VDTKNHYIPHTRTRVYLLALDTRAPNRRAKAMADDLAGEVQTVNQAENQTDADAMDTDNVVDGKSAEEKSVEAKSVGGKSAVTGKVGKKPAEKKTAEKTTAEKTTVEKTTAEKKAVEKKAAEKMAVEKMAAEKKTAGKQTAGGAKAAGGAAPKGAAETEAAAKAAGGTGHVGPDELARWSASVNELSRPSSSSLEAFLLPSDDPRVHTAREDLAGIDVVRFISDIYIFRM